jgi:hypothetical protein
VSFTFTPARDPNPCLDKGQTIQVDGDVPANIDLAPEATAMALLEKGKAYALRICKQKPMYITVRLFQGTRVMASCQYSNSLRDFLTCYGYFNQAASDVAKEQERQRRAQQEAAMRAKQQEEAAQREAEARRIREQVAATQQEARRRLEEFNKKYCVLEWPQMVNLATNPFVYEGKTIGVHAQFERMLTATEAQFWAAPNNQSWLATGQNFIVSQVPKGLLIKPIPVLVAGMVQGRAPSGLPQLTFVGIYICAQPDCREILSQ